MTSASEGFIKVETRQEIEQTVGAALKCAEEATSTVNELVARTLETAVTGKEAATTLHHAYSAQVQVARVFEWVKEWSRSQGLAPPNSQASILGECLTWMCRARDHADKLSRCFPTSIEPGVRAARIAGWADRWPQDYLEAKNHAEKSMKEIDAAIAAIHRRFFDLALRGLQAPR